MLQSKHRLLHRHYNFDQRPDHRGWRQADAGLVPIQPETVRHWRGLLSSAELLQRSIGLTQEWGAGCVLPPGGGYGAAGMKVQHDHRSIFRSICANSSAWDTLAVCEVGFPRRVVTGDADWWQC
jgi:hypothetical protein